MSKKIIALSTMLVAVLLILISVGRVTMRGITNGEVTIHQTILISEKTFYNLIESGKASFVLATFSFFIGCLLLFVPNFFLFEQSKKRSIALIVINTVGSILTFSFFNFYQYLFMMITVCILFMCNLFIQYIYNYKNKTDILITIIIVFISFINIFYLIYHLLMQENFLIWDLNNAMNTLLKEKVHISRINMACFALWFIPYGILLVKEIKGNKGEITKS